MMSDSTVETRRESGAWKAKHTRILGAALDEFIARGFNGASMDRIAAKAKVSKVTIYNHFDNKDLLYRNMVDYYVHHVHPGVPPVAPSSASPRDIMASYTLALVEASSSPRSIGMIRLMRADPQLFHESTRASGETRLLPDSKALASYLEAEVASGRLRIANCDVAARQLIGMLLENTVYQALAGGAVDLARPSLQAIVDSCVGAFVSAYGA